MSMHYAYTWCLRKPGGVRSPAIEVEQLWATMWMLELNPGPLEEEPVFLTAEPLLQFLCT